MSVVVDVVDVVVNIVVFVVAFVVVVVDLDVVVDYVVSPKTSRLLLWFVLLASRGSLGFKLFVDFAPDDDILRMKRGGKLRLTTFAKSVVVAKIFRYRIFRQMDQTHVQNL